MAKILGERVTRRSFLKTAVGTAAAAGFPTIVPASVLGQMAPSQRINVGAIGVGRISRGHDLPAILKNDGVRVMAVCDLDANRVELGKKFVNDFYARKTGKDRDPLSHG
jgi:TAT (twin-arginine translocation) pathway-exported protein